jgi:hypothetical protein
MPAKTLPVGSEHDQMLQSEHISQCRHDLRSCSIAGFPGEGHTQRRRNAYMNQAILGMFNLVSA